MDPRRAGSGWQSYRDGIAAQAPQGGGEGAAERSSSSQQRSTPYCETNFASVYIGYEDVSPGCHVDRTVALFMS
eukprot:6784952-Karenia_brevis.AAC.1